MTPETSSEALTPLQQAVYLLKQTQARLAAYEGAESEPIAVIGMGCRFPGGADSPAAYWRLLSDATDAIVEVPPDRWNIDDYYDPDPSAPGKLCTRWGGFLAQVDQFDADFFGISPREAVRVDPQHRLLLEVCWEALENAGLPPLDIAGSNTGIYVGVIANDYALLQSRDLNDMDVFSGTGSSHAVLANRVSYVLNLNGPSIALDTACSSSLVTVQLACESLRRRETDLGLAGGVNLILSPEMTAALTKAHMMSLDGRCKAFDAAADGYVRGEGCGMLVLKRLSDARADGDRVLALIRGAAVNHDGRSNGLSAPNGPAQEAVIRAALADAGLEPCQIGYVEAHGTGTRLGDPIEVEAILSVLASGRPLDQPLFLGSVKTNIGHLESAAGIAGLIKAILALRRGQIPPHLHLNRINPLLKLEGSAIEIPTELRSWPRGEQPRRAGVSSFGFGGTNAHIIVEEAPAEERLEDVCQRPRHLLTLSARSPAGLSELAERYAKYLETESDVPLADLAYTANTGRTHFTQRAAIVAVSSEEARDKLRAFREDPEVAGVHRGAAAHNGSPRIAFLFTGQGSQYAAMGRQLYPTQPTFRAALDRCAEHLHGPLDRPLLSLLEPEAGALLDQTGYTQPVMFSLEYALAELWRSWGVEPSAVLGHSVGEFAAACVAGVLTLEDGLRLIAARARLMQSLPAGGLMAAVFASEQRVAATLEGHASVGIAALNGPRNTVISGETAAVREVLARLESEGIKAKTLTTSHAFHSHLMDPILESLEAAAATVVHSPPQIEVIANLTGRSAGPDTFDPSYWSRHARRPVRFHESMQALADGGCELFLEIGPGPTLVGMGRQCLSDDRFVWLHSLRKGRDDWQSLLDSVAELYVHGAKIDWRRFDGESPRRRIDAPTYPFERRRYWANAASIAPPQGSATGVLTQATTHPLLGRRLVAAVSEQVFQTQVSAHRPALLADHRVQGAVVMSGAAYLEMALAASAAVHGDPWLLRDASVVEPLILDKTPRVLQTILTADGARAATFRIVSVRDGEDQQEPSFVTHAVGRLEAVADAVPAPVDLDAQRARFTGEPFDDQWRAEALRRSGLEPGPMFSWIARHWVQQSDAMARMRAPRDSEHAEDYCVHPGLLDCAFQMLGAALPGAGTGIDAYVPVGVDRLQLCAPVRTPGWYLVSITSLERDVAVGDIRLVDDVGGVMIEMHGVRLRRVSRDWLARLVAEPPPNWLYELAWLPEPLNHEDLPIASVEPGRWLIFDSRQGPGAAVAAGLASRGHTSEVVPAEADAAARTAAVQRCLSEGPCQGVVYLASLDVDGGPAPDLPAARERGWGGVLDLVHALTAAPSAVAPRLWLVTRGAQAAAEAATPLNLAQSPIWGLARVIAAEHPELTCTRIDLDPQSERNPADELVEEFCAGLQEDQIAYRGDRRLIARLRRLRSGEEGALDVPSGQPYRLEITSRGQLDNVALKPVLRVKPARGQVEIEVRATGLNFRDVLNVLDLYPGDPGPLGGECAGVITAVGDGVDRFRAGDEVVALAPASFASHVITSAEFVAKKPEPFSLEQAATIPIAFLSAHLALREWGDLKPGERVLIHAAAGGVGMAAIQIAQRIGAEIFATAGSPAKRDYLRSLGIEHVMDSRSLEFVDQVLQATGGEGVDLVVNSLTGEAIEAGLSVLRAGGRFMELGKTDLWDQPRVDAFKPGVAFHAIALDHMMVDASAAVERIMRRVMLEFAAGDLRPLPLRTFPIERTVDALRHMARAEHIGKVVICAAELQGDSGRVRWLQEDATYLVTGGLGGLGRKVARWLAHRGARQLVLIGRSGASDEARREIDELQASGVRVLVRCCDIAQRDEVAALIAEIDAQLPPLKGVFHLAGVLDDGVLREQTRERFDRVMAAKVGGAWHLHELTQDRSLDLFVLFSSAAALLGSPGQANYAAANAFLDALAHERRRQKLPALSVNWGSWSEVGMAARLRQSEGRRMSAAGVGWIDPEHGLDTLQQLIADQRIQAGVLPIDWRKFFERIPTGSEPAWLQEMAREAHSGREDATAGPPLLLEKLADLTAGERLEAALDHVCEQAARVLAMDEGQRPDPRRPLNELGFDSLTAVEFCNRVGRSIGQTVNPTLLFDYPTLESLTGYLLRELLQLEIAPAAEVEPEDVAADQRQQTMDDVEEMSEDEMASLVAEQLVRLQEADEEALADVSLHLDAGGVEPSTGHR